MVTDPAPIVKTKLEKFAKEYRNMLKDQYDVWGPASNYRSLAPVERALKEQGPTPEAAEAQPPVQAPANPSKPLADQAGPEFDAYYDSLPSGAPSPTPTGKCGGNPDGLAGCASD
jgi:hypothetical protein